MKRIISGKTILLNTQTNCTFVADDLDEKVQTGTRDNDKHIEWVGELDVNVVQKEYRAIAEKLWSLLDDIDTAMDMFKPTLSEPQKIKEYAQYVESKHKERFNFLTNDPKDLNKLIIHPGFNQ